MPHPLEIDVQSVKTMLDRGEDFAFIDCRDPDEYAVAKIDVAQLLPMSEVQSRVGELTPHQGKPVVVHCHHGGRSLRVAMWLRQQGFPQALSMAGGIDEWSLRIDPLVPRY